MLILTQEIVHHLPMHVEVLIHDGYGQFHREQYGQGGDADNSSNMASSSSVAGGGTDLLGLGLASEERQHPTPLPEPAAAETYSTGHPFQGNF